MRLLSLLSSATEIVHALGLGAYQVGRSHECDFPASVLSLPVCSRPSIAVDGSSAEIDRLVKERASSALSIYDLDSELISELQPTHIFTQTQCEVCAVSLKDVERAVQAQTRTNATVVSQEPHALADLWTDILRIAESCGVRDAGVQLVQDLQDEMSQISDTARRCERRPRVAAIEWLEPLMAAGNWVPELIEMAGGENLFGVAGQHSPWMTWEQLRGADPDIIIALPCGFDLPRTRSEMHWLTERADFRELHATTFVCDGNQYMNRPGPRLVDSLRIFAEIFHPNLFPPQLEGTGWEKL